MAILLRRRGFCCTDLALSLDWVANRRIEGSGYNVRLNRSPNTVHISLSGSTPTLISEHIGVYLRYSYRPCGHWIWLLLLRTQRGRMVESKKSHTSTWKMCAKNNGNRYSTSWVAHNGYDLPSLNYFDHKELKREPSSRFCPRIWKSLHNSRWPGICCCSFLWDALNTYPSLIL